MNDNDNRGAGTGEREWEQGDGSWDSWRDERDAAEARIREEMVQNKGK